MSALLLKLKAVRDVPGAIVYPKGSIVRVRYHGPQTIREWRRVSPPQGWVVIQAEQGANE